MSASATQGSHKKSDFHFSAATLLNSPISITMFA